MNETSHFLPPPGDKSSIPASARSKLPSAFFGGLLLVANLVHAGDWPQWRGPNRDGKATDFKSPQSWPKALPQKWKVTVGEGVATPALVADKLYVFSRQDSSEITRCLEAVTGKELWQDKYEALGATGPASGFSGPRSSPAVADGKVFTLGVRGTLSCLDAVSGKVVWRKDDFQGATPNFFASSSPMVVNGLCVAQLGGRDNGSVVAHDPSNGEQKWKWTGEGTAYASPVLVKVGDATLIVTLTERNVVALSTADGKLAWEAPFAAPQRSYNAATPIVDGQTVIYSGGGRGTKAVKLEKQGDTITASELWSNPDKSVQFNTAVLKDGLLYGLSQDNQFFCLNGQNGQTLWSAPVPAPEAAAGGDGGGRRGGRGGGGYGSIVDAGSVLLALTPSSELIAFQPGDKAYNEVARIKVADTPTYAHPVISDNRLFIKDKDSVTLLSIE